MEFKVNDDIKVVDETQASIFGKKTVTTNTTDSITIELTTPCTSDDKDCNKRWIDSLSDCA
jgi:hypothetical protein